MVDTQTQINTLEKLKRASLNCQIRSSCRFNYINEDGDRCAIGYLMNNKEISLVSRMDLNRTNILLLIEDELISEKSLGLNKYLAERIQKKFDRIGNGQRFINFLQIEINRLKYDLNSNTKEKRNELAEIV